MKKFVSVILSLLMVLSMTACGSSASDAPAAPTAASSVVLSGVEDGVLTVGMECAYAPTTGPRWTTPTALFPSPTTPALMPTAMTS
ncbi:MAG: hypothetical protein ACLTR8_00950 [Oscillospiraceae bacterium]